MNWEVATRGGATGQLDTRDRPRPKVEVRRYKDQCVVKDQEWRKIELKSGVDEHRQSEREQGWRAYQTERKLKSENAGGELKSVSTAHQVEERSWSRKIKNQMYLRARNARE